jgi:hypothetical protein
MFSFQQTLDQLSAAEVPNLDKAKANVEEFTREVLAQLIAGEGGREREDDETPERVGIA